MQLSIVFDVLLECDGIAIENYNGIVSLSVTIN